MTNVETILINNLKKAAESKNNLNFAEGVSKSAKIRQLDKIGYKRSEIAKMLNIRYQFVRNVLTSQK